MATLRFGQQRTLPPPRSPQRSKLPDTDVALRHLGFDADFDLSMQYKADAINAEEVTLERRLQCVLHRLRGLAQLAPLPWACVRLRKLLVPPPEGKQKEGEKKGASPDQIEDAKLKVAEKVAQVARLCVDDVFVEIDGEAIECIIQVTRPGASLLGCQLCLAQAVKDRGGGLDRGDPSGIHRAFVEAGAVEDLNMTISVSWSKERASEGVNLVHPGYVLEESQLDHIMQAADDSRKAFSCVWNEFEREPNEAESAPKLLLPLPTGVFVGGDAPEFLSIEAGFAAGLFPDSPKQDAIGLTSLMKSASEAHLMLKACLAPNSAWGLEAMNDLVEIPYEDDRRRYSSNAWDLLPEALLVDPGLKADRHVFEKSKWCQMPQEFAPPLIDITDVSRLLLIFNSCEELYEGLQRLQDKFDVVFFENRFLFPLCMGHRCMILGVRLTLPSGQSHICKLILEHELIFAVKETTSALCKKQITDVLARYGVLPREIANIKRIVLRQLGCTKGQAIREIEQELLQAFACAQTARTLTQTDGATLAQQLVEEAINTALAAGLPQARAMGAMARLQASE